MFDDDWPPPLDLGALPRVLSRADALRRGIPRTTVDARVSRGSWRRVLPRTYVTGPTVTDRDRLDAAVCYAGAQAALSGAAALFAAEVRGIRMPARVLVLVPPDNCARSTSWVQVRRTVRPYSADPWWRPARVEPARAASDLAVTMRRLDDVRTLLARVVQDGHCTVAELGAELDAGPRRGSKHMRQALAEVGRGAASAPEAEAAAILHAAGIGGFRANVELTLPDGSLRRVDLYWKRLRAVLEIDSKQWHYEEEDWTATWDRHLDLSTFGYSVIHRPPSALRDKERFARDVQAWLAGREADLRRGLA
jgi:hypothetical protein